MKKHLPRFEPGGADRRDFLKGGLAAGALTLGLPALGTAQEGSKGTFRLHYAPHLGMFRHSAGDDPIDQIKFMHRVLRPDMVIYQTSAASADEAEQFLDWLVKNT